MLFSRALSGDIEMGFLPLSPLPELGGEAAPRGYLPVPEPQASCHPPRPSSSPYCALAVTQESLGPVGLLTPIRRRGKIQRGEDTCPESHSQQNLMAHIHAVAPH